MQRMTYPMCLAVIVTLAVAACTDDSAILTEDPTGPGGPTAPQPPTMRALGMSVEGYPEAGELRAGFIYDRAGRPMEITYEVHDGLAIWQGDIILGPADEVARTASELSDSNGGPLRGVVIDDNSKRWPGGVIPYTITDATPSIVTAAIDIIEDQTPGVTLVPRTSEANYVTFQDASGCSSPIGMQGGQQFINLKVNDGVSFCSSGNAAHEILHALGMYHEHTRCDRDNFVIIDFAEIQAGKESNFFLAGSDMQGDPCGDDQAVFDVGAYDPGSMMHYGPLAFAIGSNPTIIPKPGVDGSQMGQRSAVGPTDQETIDLLYGANNAAPVANISGPSGDLLEGSVLSFDATGSTDADDDDDLLTFDWTFGDGTCGGGTPPAACSSSAPDHTYADNGNYAYSVTVSDGFDSGATGSNVIIANVAPSVDAGPDAVVESGQTYDFSGTFSDPGVEDAPWSWVIDWGFGPNTNGQTNDQSSPVEASRQVCVAGDYTVTLTVTDKDGGVGSDDLTLTVPYVDVMIDILPGSEVNPLNRGRGGILPIAVLGSAELNVADIDASSLTLGDGTDPDTPIQQKMNGTYQAHLEDVNDDGFMDLVVMFPRADLVSNGDLTILSTELVLRGFLADACTNIRGVDMVTQVGH